MKAQEILNRYFTFFEKQGHKRIMNSPLVLLNDPTTLFTSSGMQALIPYLLGEVHPQGKRLVNVQNCIRSQDIEEVGNNRHTTFFRMIGNWSLGDYFKKDQLPWFFDFLTNNDTGLGLDPARLYVTVFAGNDEIEEDSESITIWKNLFKNKDMEAEFINLGTQENAEKVGMKNGRIFAYNEKKNWWSRSGVPSKMPPGEPGGPDSEVFYDFGTPHDKKFGANCHPNCDCGRFMEIGNSVFMQYQKQSDGSFKELPQKNVDFGGGLERLAAAKNHDPDIFKTDLYANIIATIEEVSGKKYTDHDSTAAMRVIADHLKAATFLMVDGVTPSNKEQGYVLRRLLRRSAVKMHELKAGLTEVSGFHKIIDSILEKEEDIDEKIDRVEYRSIILPLITEELEKFSKSLERGLKEIQTFSDSQLNALNAFDLYQTHGFPVEITREIYNKRGKDIDPEEFKQIAAKHQELSRTASAGMFKGGLADHSERTIMGHTATHLLHQALRDVLGKHVHQTGSNITTERVRFDFNFDRRLTDEEIKQVENIVNEKIKQNLPVHFELIPTDEAHKLGAIGLFMDTYGEKSKIYFIGPSTNSGLKREDAYSIEFCGGPHVDFTGELKSFTIQKQENLGKGQKRIYGIVGT